MGLYINQQKNSNREILYQLPAELNLQCPNEIISDSPELTLCEFNQFYQWKRQMLEQGRLWMK
jgi:hypothetical protein